eukprot:scaffold19784_cov99-Isochrysis_galbana.AAC.1
MPPTAPPAGKGVLLGGERPGARLGREVPGVLEGGEIGGGAGQRAGKWLEKAPETLWPALPGSLPAPKNSPPALAAHHLHWKDATPTPVSQRIPAQPPPPPPPHPLPPPPPPLEPPARPP